MAGDATSTDTRKKALLGMPGYGAVTGGAARGFFRSSARLNVALRMQESSLLAHNFNLLWCDALNMHRRNGLDYFAMQHSDIEPPDGWLDTLVAEMEAKNLDVLGVAVPIKDVRMFIHACGSLRRKHPDLEALVIGPDDEDPAYAAECRRLVAEEGLEACLRFTGRADVAHYLARIDICVLTSLSEAQPLVLLEAGAAGIPSVATDVGSCREIIEGSDGDPVSGAGGMVVPVGDSAATASAMAALLSDASLRERMGEVMRRRVSQFYNKERIDRTYRALYDFHLGRAPPELARAS